MQTETIRQDAAMAELEYWTLRAQKEGLKPMPPDALPDGAAGGQK